MLVYGCAVCNLALYCPVAASTYESMFVSTYCCEKVMCKTFICADNFGWIYSQFTKRYLVPTSKAWWWSIAQVIKGFTQTLEHLFIKAYLTHGNLWLTATRRVRAAENMEQCISSCRTPLFSQSCMYEI